MLALTTESQCDGAILAAPVIDTLKEVEGDRIVGTVDRTNLWGAQTPQVFTRAALERARQWGPCEGTDEASWLVAAGADIRVIEARSPNPKITLPADFIAWEARLAAGPGR